MQKKEVSFALFQIVLQNREPGTSTRMSGNGCQALTDGKWGFRDDADHPFRDDPDQLIMIVGTVIAMPRNVFHRTK
jgi:hypothetical protein